MSGRCLALEKLGVSENDAYAQEGICQLCTLKTCVYDHPGPVSRADKEELKRIASVWERWIKKGGK